MDQKYFMNLKSKREAKVNVHYSFYPKRLASHEPEEVARCDSIASILPRSRLNSKWSKVPSLQTEMLTPLIPMTSSGTNTTRLLRFPDLIMCVCLFVCVRLKGQY